MSQDPNAPQQPPSRPQWEVQPGRIDDPLGDPLGDPLADPIPGGASGPDATQVPGRRAAQVAPELPQDGAQPSQQSYTPTGQPQAYHQPGYPQPGYQPGQPPQQYQQPEQADFAQHPGQPPMPHPGHYAAPNAGHSVGQNPSQYAEPQPPERAPSAQEFLANRHRDAEVGPATWGWRGWIRKLTFGLIKPKMGPAERAWREQRAKVQKSFSGPRTVVFANPKGGAAKTTSVLAAGYTFGTVRGGGVVAWDNNETRGTLGIRGEGANHHNTTRELLDDLERFSDVYESRIGDLGAFVRSQGDAHFDVLASDERADVTGQIKASDFGAVHRLLERFYHLILVDTGNNLRAENWLAAAQTADLIVVTCTVREDTGYSGLWMLDALEDAGHHDLRSKTITVLADPSPNVDAQLAKDLIAVYEQRTRAVYRVPYDAALVAGSVIDYDRLSDGTRTAWLAACAGMAEAL